MHAPETNSAPLDRGKTGYLSVTQAAARLGCSAETMRRRIARGVIPSILFDHRTRLVRIEDVDALDVRGSAK